MLYVVPISGGVADFAKYFDKISESKFNSGDTWIFYIKNCQGGYVKYLSSFVKLCNKVRGSGGKLVAILDGEVFSLGVFISLLCDQKIALCGLSSYSIHDVGFDGTRETRNIDRNYANKWQKSIDFLIFPYINSILWSKIPRKVNVLDLDRNGDLTKNAIKSPKDILIQCQLIDTFSQFKSFQEIPGFCGDFTLIESGMNFDPTPAPT